MNKLNGLITSDELVRLTSFVGSDDDVADASRICRNLIKWIWIAWGIYVFIYGYYSVYILDISYGFIPKDLYYLLLIPLLIISFLFSIIENLKIFNASYTYEVKILNKILPRLVKYLNNSDKRLVTDFQNGFNKSYFEMFNIWLAFTRYCFLFIATILSQSPSNYKVSVLAVLISLIIGLLLIGKYWVKTASTCHQHLENGVELKGKILAKRILIPSFFNLSSGFIFPIALVLLAKYSLNTLTVQVALLGGMISFSWTLLSNIEKFSISKIKLGLILSRMSQLQDQYVFNNYGFTRLCERTKPSNESLSSSKRNRSLVLDNFVPMSFSNRNLAEPSHCYTYEFRPGLYQLNGLNGVGKTTLLKSLTLPEGVLVEISSGGVAYCGKPFFNCNETLSEHREEFRYIGADSIQSDVSKLMIDLFDEYPLIKEFIQKSSINANEVQSEGEKGVISIATVYQDCVNGINEGLVFIDEILSRIYGKTDFPLRQEIIKMLAEMLKIDDTLIILIVDHVTHVEEAKQLSLKLNKIEEI